MRDNQSRKPGTNQKQRRKKKADTKLRTQLVKQARLWETRLIMMGNGVSSKAPELRKITSLARCEGVLGVFGSVLFAEIVTSAE